MKINRRLCQYLDAVPSSSIDKAVMEKTAQACVIPLDCSWFDLGTWQSIWSASDKDSLGNVVVGRAELIGCDHCLVVNQNKDSEPLRIRGQSYKVIIMTHEGSLCENLNSNDEIEQPRINQIQ